VAVALVAAVAVAKVVVAAVESSRIFQVILSQKAKTKSIVLAFFMENISNFNFQFLLKITNNVVFFLFYTQNH
jgi:hypothetical protein